MEKIKKVKILSMIGQLGNGGTEKQLYLFLKYIDKNSYEPFVLVVGKIAGRWLKPINELNVKIFTLEGKSIFNKIKKFLEIKSVIKPDIIFSWSFYTNPFCLFSSTPFIGSLRGDLLAAKKKIGYFHWKLALLPRKILVNGPLLYKQLINVGKKDKDITVIENIFDFEEIPLDNHDYKRIREKYKIPQDALVIMGIGRDCPEKNLDLFLDVVACLIKSHNLIYAFLVGNVGERISKKVLDMGLRDRVILPGETDNPYQFYRASQIFFLSSQSEGAPNCIIEAIFCGCITFVMDTIELNPPIDKKIAGILSSKNKVELIADEIYKLYHQKKKEESTNIEFLNNFSSPIIMGKYYKLIREGIE